MSEIYGLQLDKTMTYVRRWTGETERGNKMVRFHSVLKACIYRLANSPLNAIRTSKPHRQTSSIPPSLRVGPRKKKSRTPGDALTLNQDAGTSPGSFVCYA